MDQTRTDKMASTSKEKDRDTHAANGGINKLQKFEKENTVQIDLEGEEKISTLELMKNLKILCGGLLACRVLTEKKYEVTLSSAAGKRRLMDGFKIGTTNVIAKELINDELVVSFLGLPAYITDEEILGKLQGWGVSAVSAIRRRVWPGTQVADGTRFVKVKFTDTVQSLPYSTRFNTALGPEYFRVIHDKQVKVCRICIQPGHILRDCPEFLCHTCGVQGHYARECSAKKEKDKCQICHYTTKECKCNVSEHENKDEDLLKSTQNTLAQEENDMEEEYGDDTPGNMNVLDLMEPREDLLAIQLLPKWAVKLPVLEFHSWRRKMNPSMMKLGWWRGGSEELPLLLLLLLLLSWRIWIGKCNMTFLKIICHLINLQKQLHYANK